MSTDRTHMLRSQINQCLPRRLIILAPGKNHTLGCVWHLDNHWRSVCTTWMCWCWFPVSPMTLWQIRYKLQIHCLPHGPKQKVFFKILLWILLHSFYTHSIFIYIKLWEASQNTLLRRSARCCLWLYLQGKWHIDSRSIIFGLFFYG